MTLAEAEIFFKRYNGYGFQMLREEAKVYKEYKQLNISKKQEDVWRIQKIEEYHKRIQAGNEKAWVCLGHVIEMLYDLEEVSDELLEGLLDALMHISKLDVCQRILVMEAMAGKSGYDRNRCGYALYSSKQKYFEILQNTMAQIMEISGEDREEMDRLSASGKIGWTDTYYRYLTLVNKCEHMEKRLLSGENLKRIRQKKKYNYVEMWLAQDE